ncbi:hypothetical protein AAVH_41698 [Aphelenchoides avenae]|nr:hypothetical protein AAVH_41698 [Aphelenchus avenae]
MVGLWKMMALVPLVFMCSQTSAQRYLRSAVPLNDINIDVKAEDNGRHGLAGGEEAERLKRNVDPLNAINIAVNAVDNSKHGDGHGQQGDGGHQPGRVEQPEPEAPASEESERLKRQAPRLSDINIGVNATDNSKHGGGGRKGGPKIPVGPGPVRPSSPNGGSDNEEPVDPDVPEISAGDDNFAVIGAIGPNGDGHWPEHSQSEGHRLKREAPRLDDINIKVDAVDNSHQGAGASHGGAAGLQEGSEVEEAGPLARHG